MCLSPQAPQNQKTRKVRAKREAKERAEAEHAGQEAREASGCKEKERRKRVEMQLREGTLGRRRTWCVPRSKPDARVERSRGAVLCLGRSVG